MERDGDLVLNVSCSHSQPAEVARKLPSRMPDGSRIDRDINLTRKVLKRHAPANSSGKVFIPIHKLPVLDEFGLSTPKDVPGYEKVAPSTRIYEKDETEVRRTHRSANEKILPREIENNNQRAPDADKPKSILKKTSIPVTSESQGEVDSSSKRAKRKKRKKREEEPKIIPNEVQAVAGGLPPSFPKHRIKKFTEEYHNKKRKSEEEGEDNEEPEKKKRRSFVPGLNPRKREKASNLFTECALQDLEDLHPYLVSNLEQNFEIKKLTKIQELAMPTLLKTRLSLSQKHFMINSGVGSGKILTYVVPIVNNLALLEPRIDRTSGIYALVLLPTRELAAKVYDIFLKLCRSFLWVVPGLLTGGERKKSEKARLRKGLNILITTPGRLIDHIEHSRSMIFSKMKYCVMADAHKLLDPERAEVAKKIAIVLRKKLPKDCVRCVVTATLTKKLEKLCEIFVMSPHIIDAFKDFA